MTINYHNLKNECNYIFLFKDNLFINIMKYQTFSHSLDDAINRNDLTEIDRLFICNLNFDVRKHFGKSREEEILTRACIQGQIDIVKHLTRNYEYNKGSNNYPFYEASAVGQIHIVEYFLSQGNDINVQHGYLLRMASLNGQLEMVKYLVDHGADVNVDYNYPLYFSSRNGYIQVAKYLIEHGAIITDEIVRDAHEDVKEFFEKRRTSGLVIKTNRKRSQKT